MREMNLISIIALSMLVGCTSPFFWQATGKVVEEVVEEVIENVVEKELSQEKGS